MSIRVCSYNIEWFNRLFERGGNQRKTDTDSVSRFEAIRDVLLRLDADLIGIVEAPNSTVAGNESTVTRLQDFANWAGLRATQAMTGIISGGSQELAVLFDPATLNVAHVPGGDAGSRSNPPFDGEIFIDTDDDRIKEVYKHYRPPLEIRVDVQATGATFHAMVVHTKSKGIFNNMDMMHWDRENRRNRLKLFAECTWIRNRVDEWIEAGHQVLVMGDINDGPGMDYYEQTHGRSAVEIVMGDLFQPDRILWNHAGKPKWGRYGWSPSSARFKDRVTEDPINVLIDHILVSSGLRLVDEDSFQIWNPYDNERAGPIRNEIKEASDHFPVTIDLDV